MKRLYQETLFSMKSEEIIDEAEKQITEEQRTVDYEVHEYPIEVIVQKYVDGLEDNTNDVFIPPYQRKFVWDEKKQSKFIESLLLGLPIPYIFTADNDGRMEVIDGSQRIRTLDAFLSNLLELQGLKILDKLNGFFYKDLPPSRQKKFKKKNIRLIDLTEKATKETRIEMFGRINTTPVKLNDMQVRKGLFEGEFQDFLIECTENIKFKLLCPVSHKKAEQEERLEMVLRYFAYCDRYQQFVHIVKDFLDAYMKDMQAKFDYKVADKLREDFENMLDFVWTYFPYGFKKSVGAKSTPRVRFEAIAVGVHLALKVKADLVPKDVMNWLNSPEFDDHTTSDAANNRLKVIGRLEYVRDKLLEK